MNYCVMCGRELPEEWESMVCQSCLEIWGDFE